MKSVYRLPQLVTMIGLAIYQDGGRVCVECTAVRHAMHHQRRVGLLSPGKLANLGPLAHVGVIPGPLRVSEN